MTLAKRYGSSLELLIAVFQDLHPAYFEPLTATPLEFHDSIMAGHRAMLERYVTQAGEEGVGAIGEALWGPPILSCQWTRPVRASQHVAMPALLTA